MKKVLCVLALLCCLMTCARGESAYSGHDMWYTRMAEVNGEVYCLGEPAPLWVNSAVYRLSPEGKTAVCRQWNGWEDLYAAGDRLLLVHGVLNVGELLGSIPLSVREAELLNPETGRITFLTRFTPGEKKGVTDVFAAAGHVYRTVRDGDSWELQRLGNPDDRGSWQTVVAWTGSVPDARATFCVIGSGRQTMLYEYASGKAYDVTRVAGKVESWSGVMEDGVLYRVEKNWLSTWLTATDLTTGEQTQLLRLEKDGICDFLLDAGRAVILYDKQAGTYRAETYDRSTWTLTGSVVFSEYPNDALLMGDWLCVSCPYAEAGAEFVHLTTGEAVSMDLN
ncbi:MAG: hypothetical protein IJ343_12820 [Clostridia bacterium]|nr:hypothetical protein [Clostridia bacterium]